MPSAQKLRGPHPSRSCPSGWGIERSWTVFLLAATTVAVVLYRFPPKLYPFYPRCPIQEYLHLQCPGCGATRAISALLHGDLIAALHFNAFAVLVVFPAALIYAVICLKRALQTEPHEAFHAPTIPRLATIALTLLTAAFTVLRNF